MGQIVKRKRKGRPPKSDLVRRRSAGDTVAPPQARRSLRPRSIRYNLDFDDDDDDVYFEDYDDDDEVDLRREKKVKLVVKLPQKSESHAPPPPLPEEAAEDTSASSSDGDKPFKKRKIDDGDYENYNDDGDDGDDDGDGDSGGGYEDRDEKVELERRGSVPGILETMVAKANSIVLLPDKNLLELILDKLQKKDTYGVFAEPVDPEELPDYHDVIENPMDFATVRTKLGNGSYSTLNQLENDVFLICTNAMRYNSPDTVYFKQARSIQELASKKFERLRTEIECSEKELKLEQKTRPNSIKKPIKKPISRSTQEPVGSDFSSGATLATTGDVNPSSNTNQASGCDRPNNIDGVVDGTSSVVDNNAEKQEDSLSGKVVQPRFGRKSFVLDESRIDENRRATYNISTQSTDRSESIFLTFEDEDKQLVSVGLNTDHSYARSLARFAATLGPIAWKVASQRIEQALPTGFKYGRGWVGEYEPLPTPVLMLETRIQTQPAFGSKLNFHGDMKNCQTASTMAPPPPVKDPAANGPASETKPKPPLFGFGLTRSPNSVIAADPHKNPLSKSLSEPENKGLKQVELTRLSNGSDHTTLRSPEMVSRPNGVGAGGLGLPNGKGMNMNMNSNLSCERIASPNSNTAPTQPARPATYFALGRDQGLTDPVQLMKMMAENGQKQQQKPSNHPSVNIPSSRREESGNAAAVAARAWMSIGAGGFKPVDENVNPSLSPRINQISADSLYNPTRENPMRFQNEKNSFPLHGFAAQQPVRMGNEAQFLNRQMGFPQFVTADLSRFQVQSPWHGLGPHTQQRQKQESLPPDLNIGFQSGGSPVRQSSGVLVDSQQPDLALQL